MKKYFIAVLGLALAAVFAILYIVGALVPLEDRLYDLFLRFRTNRPRTENIVFLNVDDPAIDQLGVWPWPRYAPGDGLMRLKEYGSLDVIFDLQFIDNGPKGINNDYLNSGLGRDFDNSLYRVNSAMQDAFSSIRTGRAGGSQIDSYADSLSSLIRSEYRDLQTKSRGIIREVDQYLAQTVALNGNAWSTIWLTPFALEGEWASRLPIAQERFAYPITATNDAHRGDEKLIDVLPALPLISTVAKGAGFVNYNIDRDGVLRRTHLAQNVRDHWYLKLAFAPLVNYLGNPEIYLQKNKMTIKQAKLPGGRIKDIVIPLDNKGGMLLDFPKENFYDSFSHLSFANIVLVEQAETALEQGARSLAASNLSSFAQIHSPVNDAVAFIRSAVSSMDAMHAARNTALEEKSDLHFNQYIEHRNNAYSALEDLFLLSIDKELPELTTQMSRESRNEAEKIAQSIGTLKETLERRNEINAANEKMLKDKFIIIGLVAEGATEYGPNPFYGEYLFTGIPAVTIDTILSESFLTPLGIWWSVFFMLIFVPLFLYVSEKLPHVLRAITGFAVILFVLITAILLFRFTGIYWGSLGFILVMTIAVITREIISFAGSEKEKNFIRSAFSTYVSHDVVKELIADPSRLQLGGANRHMTAIFTDVKGFSTLSEKLHPEELVSLLNRYLSAMSDIVLAEKGTIDKYEGDAIIAFFGAPLELPDHALRACISAINMKKTEAELNKIIAENNLSPIPLLTRIGINTGSMVAGNMGTTNKMNYTIMGNAVNLAARLEGVNKQYETWILASEDTIKETGEHLLSRKLDRVRVVGINEPVRIYELLDTSEHAGEQDQKLVKVFHEALDLYEKRQWNQATDGFKEAYSIKEDAPSKLYLDRCVQFISTPPEDNWDGVNNLTSK